tara:strand:+ start:156 stop:458 length:303 start_codon:yes stop_codon:yes gene_type:complete
MIIFIFIVCILIFLWWIDTNGKRKNQKHKSNSLASRKTFKDPQANSTESISEFQQWILNYAQKKSPEELNDSLRMSFEKNDWSLLEPLVYEKWSKFKWDI